MKVVSLKNKLVDYVCPRYKEDITFKLKVLDTSEVSLFHELHKEAQSAEGQEMFEIHSKLIELGLDHWIDAEGEEHRDETPPLEWFNIVALSDQVVKVNCYTIENVKK